MIFLAHVIDLYQNGDVHFRAETGRHSAERSISKPRQVTAMPEAAKAEKDQNKKDAIFDDFHNGIYEEDARHDLLSLIAEAVK
jgi:hypothetical protein